MVSALTATFDEVTDTLLRSLREHMLDESAPLAGLLRKCLLLGAETGSDSLRLWARSELNGYPDDAKVPDYRTLDAPIFVDSISGFYVTRGRNVSRAELPQDSWQYIPPLMSFRRPVDELEQWAQMPTITLTHPGLDYAKLLWNASLDEFEAIMAMHYIVTGATISGMLGQIRTRLVDVVAQLTAATPLTELPAKERVDAAMNMSFGDVHHTTVHQANGPLAIGTNASAHTTGMSVQEVLQLLEVVRAAVPASGGAQADEVAAAVRDLSATLAKDAPETGEVVKQSGRLRSAADKLGVAAVSAAVTAVTTTVTDLAMSGAFG